MWGYWKNLERVRAHWISGDLGKQDKVKEGGIDEDFEVDRSSQTEQWEQHELSANVWKEGGWTETIDETQDLCWASDQNPVWMQWGTKTGIVEKEKRPWRKDLPLLAGNQSNFHWIIHFRKESKGEGWVQRGTDSRVQGIDWSGQERKCCVGAWKIRFGGIETKFAEREWQYRWV